MLMLVLGFDRRARAPDRSVHCLLSHVWHGVNYYGLHLTLLQKSGILAASGVLCLMASVFVRYRYREHREFRVQEENA